MTEPPGQEPPQDRHRLEVPDDDLLDPPEPIREPEGHEALDAAARRKISQHNVMVFDAWQFQMDLRADTPRTLITYGVLGLNVIVFIAMVASGVHPMAPETKQIFDWGGLFGPSVAAGEWWRLLTANYIHIGVFHILFNMWCLWAAGRFAERLFGSPAFLVLYTLSGLGGSVASLWVSPVVVGAGASGAVFGVFGGVLGFMLARRGTFPLLILKPLLTSSAIFIGYNLYYGYYQPGIDNAAHVGGLVTGFVCGMLLSRRIPVPAGGAPPVRYVYALVVAALIAGGAVLGAQRVAELPPSAEEAYNAFVDPVEPLLREFDGISADSQKLYKLCAAGRLSAEEAHRVVTALVERAEENLAAAKEVECPRGEVARLREILEAAFLQELHAVKVLELMIATGRAPADDAFIEHLGGAHGLFLRFIVESKAFELRHGLARPRDEGAALRKRPPFPLERVPAGRLTARRGPGIITGFFGGKCPG